MTATPTLEEVIAIYGVEVDPHLDRAMSVPVSKFVRQGDVIVIPESVALTGAKPATVPVPAEGIAVVRGENGGNTHLLLASGPVFFDAAPASWATKTLSWSDGRNAEKVAELEKQRLTLGTLTVPEGSTAYLAHPEHAYTGIEPGQYTIRRQREQAEEIRLVSD